MRKLQEILRQIFQFRIFTNEYNRVPSRRNQRRTACRLSIIGFRRGHKAKPSRTERIIFICINIHHFSKEVFNFIFPPTAFKDHRNTLCSFRHLRRFYTLQEALLRHRVGVNRVERRLYVHIVAHDIFCHI